MVQILKNGGGKNHSRSRATARIFAPSIFQMMRQGFPHIAKGIFVTRSKCSVRYLPVVLSVLTAASIAFAAGTASQVFEIVNRGKPAYCGIVKKKWEPVYAVKDGGFSSIAARLRALEKAIPNAKGKAKTKLENERKKLTAIFEKTKKTCAKGPTGPSPGLTPTATPTATAAPPSNFDCFIGGGDIRPGCFGIPVNLTGNLNRGEIFFLNNCTGCHARRPARTYPEVKNQFLITPQMQPFEPGEQDLADIVAYLNRFNF